MFRSICIVSLRKLQNSAITPRVYISSLYSNTNKHDIDLDEKCTSLKSYDEKLEVVKKFQMVLQIQDILNISQEDARELVSGDKKIRVKSLKLLVDVVELLYEEHISNSTIMENTYLLTTSLDMLKPKLQLLKKMKPNELEDFVPLLRLNLSQLKKILNTMERERKLMPYGNRIYFFSTSLKIKPKIVAKYFSTHPFMFDIALNRLFANFKIFMKYKVSPINLLRDLWAFKYQSKTIELRLARAESAQKDKIMPWMVRCPEDILDNSLRLSKESKVLLGENESVLHYISKRLGYDIETTKYIVSKHPAVLKVRIKKIKEILDFFLEETNYTAHDIAQVPRVLCHSLETSKERLDELKRLECPPSSLVIICKSRIEYQKFINNWNIVSNKIKKYKQDQSMQHKTLL